MRWPRAWAVDWKEVRVGDQRSERERRGPRGRKEGRGGWGTDGGGDGASGGVELATKAGGERGRNRGEGFKIEGRRREDRQIVNIGTQLEGKRKCKKGSDKEVEDKKKGRDRGKWGSLGRHLTQQERNVNGHWGGRGK